MRSLLEIGCTLGKTEHPHYHGDQLHVFEARTTTDIYQADFVVNLIIANRVSILIAVSLCRLTHRAGAVEISNQWNMPPKGKLRRLSACVVAILNLFIVRMIRHNRLTLRQTRMQNLANDPALADKMAHFTALMNARDLERFDADVRESRLRHIVYAALGQGALLSTGISRFHYV